MSKKIQTRRTISVKGLTYQRLKDYQEATGESMSGFVEEIVSQHFTF